MPALLLGSQQQTPDDWALLQPSQQGYNAPVSRTEAAAGAATYGLIGSQAVQEDSAVQAVQQRQPLRQQQGTGSATAPGAARQSMLVDYQATAQQQQQPPASHKNVSYKSDAVAASAPAAQEILQANPGSASEVHNTLGHDRPDSQLLALTDSGNASPNPSARPSAAMAETVTMLKHLSSLEDQVMSMTSTMSTELPKLLTGQDELTKQIQGLIDSSSLNHRALEAQVQLLTTSLASIVTSLTTWQADQQQQLQRLQEQLAQQQPQMVVTNAACQTSPAAVALLQHATAQTVALVAAGDLITSKATVPNELYHLAAVAAAAAPRVLTYNQQAGVHCSDHHAIMGMPADTLLNASQLQGCLKQDCGHSRADADDAAVAAGWQQDPHVMTLADAEADDRAVVLVAAGQDACKEAETAIQQVDSDYLMEGQADQTGGETADDPAQQPQQTRQRGGRRPARKPANKPAAKPRGRRGKAATATAKAAKSEPQLDTAAAEVQADAAPGASAAKATSGKTNSNLVQSKLNFTSRVTRSIAAKDAAAAAAVAASKPLHDASARAGAAAAAPGQIAQSPADSQKPGWLTADQHTPVSAASADVADSMDAVQDVHKGTTAAAVKAGQISGAAAHAVDAPRALPAWLLGDRVEQTSQAHQQQVTAGGRLQALATAAGSGVSQKHGEQGQKKSHLSGANQETKTLAESGIAAAAAVASGRSRQFHRRVSSNPATSSGAAFGTAAKAATGNQQTPPAALPPPVHSRMRGSAAGMSSACAGAQVSAQVAGPAQLRSSAHGSGQAPAKMPAAAANGVGRAVTTAAKPASSMSGHCSRPGLPGQQQQQQLSRPQASGGSRLMGMQRSQPVAPAVAAAPSSSVAQVFGDMDSDSMDCVLGDTRGQQQYGVHNGAATKVTVGKPNSSNPSAAGANNKRPLTDDDDDDIAQLVAAQMARHRSKQRRLAGAGSASHGTNR